MGRQAQTHIPLGAGAAATVADLLAAFGGHVEVGRGELDVHAPRFIDRGRVEGKRKIPVLFRNASALGQLR